MEIDVDILDTDVINDAVEKNNLNMINQIEEAIQNNNSEIDKIYLNNLLNLNWLQKLTPKSIICFWDILVDRKYSYHKEGEQCPVQFNIWQSLSVKQLNDLCNTEDYYTKITNFIQKNRELEYGLIEVSYIECDLDKYFGEPIVSQGFTSYPFYIIAPFWDNDFGNKWSSLNENAKKLLFRYAIKQLFTICNNVANQNDGIESFKSLSGLLNSISFLIKKYNVNDDLSVYANILVIRKLGQNVFLDDKVAIEDKNKVLECLNALAEFKQLGVKFQDETKKVAELLRDNKKVYQNIDFEFYFSEIKNLDSYSIITKFDKNWFRDRQICSQVLESLSYQQINNLVAYNENSKSGSKFISKLLKTICYSRHIYDKSSGDFLGFDKTARNNFFGAQQIKKSGPILVDVVENNMQILNLKAEEKNVTEYKFFSGTKFKNFSSEVKNLFVTILLNSFLNDLCEIDEDYQQDNCNKHLPSDQMLAAMNECYINFSEVLKSFSETDNNCIKIDLDVFKKLISQIFARNKVGYLKPFLTKLIDLPGFDKAFVEYVKNILPLCDSNLLDENCKYADVVNQTVENKNQDQIDFIGKLMQSNHACFFHRQDYNFIQKLSYDAVITFGEYIFSCRMVIAGLSENYIKMMFENTQHRQFLENALKKRGNDIIIYEFMEFGNLEPAKELPVWLLKINENDNLQDDNFSRFTFQTLIIPDNIDSVFIAHDINVRINKLLKGLLNNVKNDGNNQENAEKYIDTKRAREVFVNIYCLIRKYARHNLKIEIDEEIINSIVEKTKKENLDYLATCFNNFSLFSSFGQLTQKEFAQAWEKCLDIIDFNSKEFLQRLEFDENFAKAIFLSDKIQKLSVDSLISKANKLKSYPSCLVYLSDQQINNLATRQNGLEIIKHCLGVDASQNKIFRIYKEANVFHFKHIESKLKIMTPQLKRLFIEQTISSRLKQLPTEVNDCIRRQITIIHRVNGVVTGITGPYDKARQCITKTFDSICSLMRNPAVTNDLNIEIDYFVLDTLTNLIPFYLQRFYLQKLEQIIELPGWGKKTLYYLKQAINFLSFGYFCNENSLMAKVRNIREQNINLQNPVPRMENNNLNIQQ